MTMKTHLIYSALLILLITATACSQSPPPAIGQPASPQQIQRIASSVEKPYGLSHVYTVKSELHKNAWYVAGVLTSPFSNVRMSGAVWIHTRGPDNPGITNSVDGHAKEFSPWGDASSTALNVTMVEDQPQQLEAYVEWLARQEK